MPGQNAAVTFSMAPMISSRNRGGVLSTGPRRYHDFLAQAETMLGLGNGYLGLRGSRKKVAPTSRTLPSSMGSTRRGRSSTGKKPTVLPKTGQTICNVTDSKIIKLFVDDKLFWLPDANLLSCDRRLNIKSGTLDREILWETPAGKQVLIASRRLVTFADRHVAAISYCVTLLNAEAPVVISSEMVAMDRVPAPKATIRERPE